MRIAEPGPRIVRRPVKGEHDMADIRRGAGAAAFPDDPAISSWG